MNKSNCITIYSHANITSLDEMEEWKSKNEMEMF